MEGKSGKQGILSKCKQAREVVNGQELESSHAYIACCTSHEVLVIARTLGIIVYAKCNIYSLLSRQLHNSTNLVVYGQFHTCFGQPSELVYI